MWCAATLRLLEAVPIISWAAADQARLYQAGSSEMFGAAPSPPQSEATAFYPRSLYAVAKVAAHWYAVNLWRSGDLFVASGIRLTTNRRVSRETGVTRKISRARRPLRPCKQSGLYLGNLEAVRDWGFAGDYVEAMWRMLRHGRADDFVIATSSGHSVRQFLELAFGRARATTATLSPSSSSPTPAAVNCSRASTGPGPPTPFGWRAFSASPNWWR